MREVQFAEHLNLVVPTHTVARGRPLAHAIHREKRRLGIWGWKKRRGGMRLVVFGKKNFARKTRQFVLDERLHPDALANPQRNRHQETPQPTGRVGEVAV